MPGEQQEYLHSKTVHQDTNQLPSRRLVAHSGVSNSNKLMIITKILCVLLFCLISYSLVVRLCATTFTVKKFYILLTESSYVLCIKVKKSPYRAGKALRSSAG